MSKFWPVPEWISTYSYKQTPRSFGAKRASGRTHADCDLYAPLGSPVLAITAGRVVESRDFYLGTFQVTIDHGALGVVRCGEISHDGIPKTGSVVEAGQRIGKIGLACAVFTLAACQKPSKQNRHINFNIEQCAAHTIVHRQKGRRLRRTLCVRSAG